MSTSVSGEKERLRAQMLCRRREIPICRREGMHAQITRQVCALPEFTARDAALLCYASRGLEVDTWKLLRLAWSFGKQVALPRCEKGGVMTFHLVRGESALHPGIHDISEPDASCPLYVPQPDDLCIVPGLAFDRDGYRLGWGGGYYDRYLARYPMHTVGICYPACMEKTLPRDIFDVPVRRVIC